MIRNTVGRILLFCTVFVITKTLLIQIDNLLATIKLTLFSFYAV